MQIRIKMNEMKYVANINWAIIALLFIFGVVQLLAIHSSSMDAAGKGMEGGFALILIVFVGIMAGLNLIKVQWVRVGVLSIFAFLSLYALTSMF
jgi:hypothetical protein